MSTISDRTRLKNSAKRFKDVSLRSNQFLDFSTVTVKFNPIFHLIYNRHLYLYFRQIYIINRTVKTRHCRLSIPCNKWRNEINIFLCLHFQLLSHRSCSSRKHRFIWLSMLRHILYIIHATKIACISKQARNTERLGEIFRGSYKFRETPVSLSDYKYG